MDDSKFLPPDLAELPDLKSAFFDLESTLNDMSRILTDAYSSNNPKVIKDFENEIQRKLRRMYVSMDMPPKDLNEDPMDLISNFVINVNPLLDEIDSFLTSNLYTYSLSLGNNNYVLGLTKNISDYIVSEYTLTRDHVTDLQSRGKYFLYDRNTNDIFVFEYQFIPTIFKHLLFNGKEVDLFLLLQRLRSYFTE